MVGWVVVSRCLSYNATAFDRWLITTTGFSVGWAAPIDLNVIYELRFVLLLLLSRELIQPGRRPFGLVRRARARALLFTWPSNEFDERSSPCGKKRRERAPQGETSPPS